MKSQIFRKFIAVIAISRLAQALPAATPVEPVDAEADSRSIASTFQPDLTPGYVLIEGDIQIPLKDYFNLLKADPVAKATFGTVNFWPGGLVPYDFVTSGAGAVSAANQVAATNALAAIAARAGVTFRPALPTDGNRIRFQNSGFNNSPVGFQTGTQIINLVSWGSQITICHEVYHSLGFWHEQSRPDRTNYITVNSNNICGSAISTNCTAGTNAGQCCFSVDASGQCISSAFNFNIQNGASTYGPYDFGSFMHYGRAAFSCNGLDTITVNAPWNGEWQNRIGQRTNFSYFDAITCRALYPFSNDRWLDRSYGGPANGTFAQPYNNTTLADALAGVPSGGTLFVKHGNAYSAVGTFNTPVTIEAPDGTVTFGN